MVVVPVERTQAPLVIPPFLAYIATVAQVCSKIHPYDPLGASGCCLSPPVSLAVGFLSRLSPNYHYLDHDNHGLV